jgi:FtsP/CotA-like multicopper oxidase with cupredoxin domain
MMRTFTMHTTSISRRVSGILVGVAVAGGVSTGASRLDSSAADSLPVISANDNRHPAGVLRGNQLTLHLVVRSGLWYPESEAGPSLTVEGFAEEGAPPMIPGPLVRVPLGTRVLATVRNALPDTLYFHGFAGGSALPPDSLRIAPGERIDVAFTAERPGAYIYRGATLHSGGRVRNWGTGGQLVGTIIVDSAGAPPDRVFVISFWDPTPDGAPTPGAFAFVLNGKSWPNTERLHYALGDTVHWIVVNASRDPHPMHLHGFYYRVDAAGNWYSDTLYTPDQRRVVVTESMQPMTTMSLTWSPDRPGNWIFHCHNTAHTAETLHDFVAGRMRASSMPRHHERGRHAEEGMAGLVLGIQVAGAAPRTTPVARRLRLLVQERAGVYGKNPGRGYVLYDGSHEPARDSVAIPGPPLELTVGERTEVTVLNRMSLETSVHWHGIELESYSDGIPDWSGGPGAIAPAIAPGDSFRAILRLRRAGTFIYHAHVGEYWQINSGLYGPLLVLARGQRRDAATDHVLLLSYGGPDSTSPLVLNGAPAPVPVEWRSEVTHRLRLINITGEEQVEVALYRGVSLTEWRPVAKDGADLPPVQATPRSARIRLGPGETADFEITPAAGDIRLEVKGEGSSLTLAVRVR